MKNICNVITTLDPRLGGAGSATIEISKALSLKKIKVTILTNDKKNSKFFKSNHVKIINLGKGFGKFNLRYSGDFLSPGWALTTIGRSVYCLNLEIVLWQNCITS